MERRFARFADGSLLDFDTALIATGAVPRKLDVPRAGLPGVHALRTRADAASIVAALAPGQNAVVVGTSFIGLEAACGLRAQKIGVAVVGPDDIPFVQQFGEAVGQAIRALHEANGVIFHTGTKPVRLQGDGRVASVVLKNGETLPADIVLVAVGVSPATGFVRGAEQSPDGGLSVDAGMRLSDGVYAAGDVARFPLPFGGSTRIEHWRVAQQQGRIAARNMAGGRATYDGVPFLWTYHYGKNIEYVGHAEKWHETVIHGDVRAMNFVALLVNDGLVAAAVACQRERTTAKLLEAMRGRLDKAAAQAVINETY